MLGRCLGGPVYVITASVPWDDWPYEIAYGWGALVKALVLYRACQRNYPATILAPGSGPLVPLVYR